MKKFAMGAIVGASLSLGASALASNSPEVSFFPVKYIFNSVEKQLPEEYTSLNYNGHAYVPIRFIAENSSMNIGYDSVEKRVIINYGVNGQEPAPIPSEYLVNDVTSAALPYITNNHMAYGNIKVTKEGINSRVSFQIKNDIPQNDLGGTLRLFDEKANLIGQLPINHTFDTGISTYENTIEGDATNFKYATLTFGKVEGALYHPLLISREQKEQDSIIHLKSKMITEDQLSKLGDKKMDISNIASYMKLSNSQVSQLVNTTISG
ncbi:stalk domain-containing protein [Paenibacillus elgii]|uniref:stalk domain-containing protein n=1 Tax=Paenibacillus elgii TaxID=189691 RepID=UPI0013D2240A|nr:stalk domain-containing protein [Paenibacillus elgii]